ncbi:MAG: hypothetical protein ACF8PG_08310 [Maioricimonas sp. JB045]|uniref:hypothetical protein n=1 Tax=Maioricimonas sp. JC845 TaxID=3232138 RepID=UPI00345A1A66
MNDATTAESTQTAVANPPGDQEEHLFDRSELKQFDADDVEAGRAICKMLSLFFFYTVIVMGLSTYITYRWITGG